jgi:hypothetical protein
MGQGVNGVADLDAASSNPFDPTDAALLTAIARGERDAFAALYARHAPWLQVRLRRRCSDPDVVSEASEHRASTTEIMRHFLGTNQGRDRRLCWSRP